MIGRCLVFCEHGAQGHRGGAGGTPEPGARATANCGRGSQARGEEESRSSESGVLGSIEEVRLAYSQILFAADHELVQRILELNPFFRVDCLEEADPVATDGGVVEVVKDRICI